MYHTHAANWCYNNGNLWDLRMYYVQKNHKCQMFILLLFYPGLLFLFYIKCSTLRAWYNGSTSASQAEDEGSIPFARTKFEVGCV